jgi:hypothetical protein
VRATSIAILLFVVNLIGYGIGPPAMGLIADAMTTNWIAASPVAGQISATCSVTDTSLSAVLVEACRDARAHGVQWASVAATCLFAVAGLFFLLAGRTFLRDLFINQKTPAAAAA